MWLAESPKSLARHGGRRNQRRTKFSAGSNSFRWLWHAPTLCNAAATSRTVSAICLNCHLIQSFGGRRGPDLTYIADKLTRDNLIIRILNGGTNMPAFSSSLKPQELDALVAFLESRKRPIRLQDQSAMARK
jgi:mono/diheme cytochrome c family protein